MFSFSVDIYIKDLSFIIYCLFLYSWGRRGGPRNVGGSGRGQGQGQGRGRGRGRGRGGGRGRGKKDAVEMSAEELDKELETYHAEAMQIS